MVSVTRTSGRVSVVGSLSVSWRWRCSNVDTYSIDSGEGVAAAGTRQAPGLTVGVAACAKLEIHLASQIFRLVMTFLVKTLIFLVLATAALLQRRAEKVLVEYSSEFDIRV